MFGGAPCPTVRAKTEIRRHEFEGTLSITFDCDTPADEIIEDAGHEANGYFWEGVAQLVIAKEAPAIADKISYDSEGSMFCAVSEDGEALEVLAGIMGPVTNDPERVAAILEEADAMGFEFDD